MAEQTHFIIDSSNARDLYTFFGGFNVTGGLMINYNGVEAMYFPKSFVEKGFTTGSLQSYTYPGSGPGGQSQGNVLWFGDRVFLDQDNWNYLKPAKLEQSFVDEVSKRTKSPTVHVHNWNGQTYQTRFDMRDVPDFQDGYIFDLSKYREITNALTGPGFTNEMRSYSPYRIPSGMGVAPDGNLSYVGYTQGGGGYDRRSDLWFINNSPEYRYGGSQYQWHNCGLFGCGWDDFMGSTLGKLITLGARIYSPWFNLGYTVGNLAFNDGKIGDVALAVINLNMPTGTEATTAAQGTMFEIPQIASMTSDLAKFYEAQLGLEAGSKVAAAAAMTTVNTGLNYLGNGQDFEKAFTTAAAQYVGNVAASTVASQISQYGQAAQKIMSETTKAVTKAALLNQDVTQAGLAAFVQTSIPLALDGALEKANLTLPTAVKQSINQAAIQAALLPNADINEILRSAAISGLVRSISDKTTSQAVKDGVVKSDDKAAFDKVMSYVGQALSGRSIDEIMNTMVINDTMRLADLDIKNYSAQSNGWKDWAQLTDAKARFGADVTPQFYEERVVSPEKIIAILDQEGVPPEDRQNIIDFYQGIVGKDATAAQVLADIRNFVNPLYATEAEIEYVRSAFSGLEEFDQDFYREEYDAAMKAAKAGNYSEVERIANIVNKTYTTTSEAEKLIKEAFSLVGQNDYQPTTEDIKLIKGQNQISAYTIAQNLASIKATTFDGKQFENLQEASQAAKQAGFNTFEAADGVTYKVMSPIEETTIREEVSNKATFSEAFADARARLGPGKTFLWNGKQYTTNILPPGVFDASRSSDVSTAAILAHANKSSQFVGPDGKIYTIPDSAREMLDTAVNQSPAETKRLLAAALVASPNETKAETQRLMDAPGRGTMDYISAGTSQLLGTTLNGFAQLLTDAGKSFALLNGDMDFDNAVIRAGQEIERYASTQDAYGYNIQAERFARAYEAANKIDDPYEKNKLIWQGLKDNPLVAIKLIGTEAVQEAPWLAAFVGASIALAPVGGAAVLIGGGLITATGAFLEIAGSAAESAYKASKAQGDDEQTARDKAYTNAASAWAIETALDYAANKFALGSIVDGGIKSITGALGVGVSNTVIGGITGLGQGFSQSLAEQLIVNPDTADVSKALTDGFVEMYIGGPSQGALAVTGYALTPNIIIGKDYSGNDVSINDILVNNKIVDSSTLNTSAVVGTTGNGNPLTLGGMFTMMPTYDFNAEIQQTYLPMIFSNPDLVVGKDALGNDITYGEVISQTNEQNNYFNVYESLANKPEEARNEIQKSFIEQQFNQIGFTPTEEQINDLIVSDPLGSQSIIDNTKTLAFQEVAAQENYKLSDAALKNMLSPDSNIKTIDDLKSYIDPLATTAEEAKEYLRLQGYTQPTDEQVAQLMELSEEQARNQAIEIADPYFFDAEEIKAAAQAEGITLTDEQARALARETDEAEATAAYRAELDPQAVIEDEAREFFNFFGYTPNSDELAQFVLAKPESEVKDLIGQYVDPRQVTKDEVETFIKGIGYEATPEEISQFVRQGPDITQEGVFGEIGSYIDPRMVTEEEVRQAYDLLGLKKPTTEDIQKLVGQYDQADLSSRAEANLEVARINSIMEQLDTLATTANQETLSAINNVRLDLTGQLQALGVDVGKPAVTDDPSTPDIDESQPATGLYAQIQAQSADTRQALLSKMAEYEAAGISRDQALDQAINDVSNQLGIAKTELSTQIGKPAIQDDPTTTIDESAPPTGIYQTLFEMEQARIAEAEAIRQAMEEQRLAQQVEEANRAAATQRQQLAGKGPQLLEKGMAGILPFLGAAAAIPTDEGAKFKDPFITSKTGQEEFEGSLAEFQKQVAQSDYLNPQFGEAQMQEFMGMPQNTVSGESMPNYFTYGQQSDIDRMFNPFGPIATSFNPFQPMLAAKGGLAVLMAGGGSPMYAGGGLPVVAHSGKHRIDFREGAAVSGPGDGQSDDIPAMLADGEFVFPADVVAALGNGSTKAGSEKLYDMMHSIRSYHRSAKPEDLPPPAKASPLDYLKKSSRARR